MNSSSPILRLLKPGRQNDQKPNSMLYSAAALGAIGSLIAPELMFAEVVQTFVLPQGYRKTDDGRVILRTQDGQPLYLTEEQFVILEDGLLLVTDELAQNTMQNLPVMGALRANGLLTGTPLASDDGGFIETTTDNPVWTGGRGPIQDFGLGTYQLAQAGVAKVAEETVDTVDTDLLLGSGVSLIALVSGLFGATASSDQTEAETPDGGTGQPPSGGGGGGGGGTTFSGTVIKGPLVNAFVFFDENGNGLFDAGEPNFTTSSTGGFSISSSAANPKLIVTTNDQTIDTTTGTILSGMTFKSPLGASVVSPLTTMMEETGLSVAEIKSVLGLPATVNPLTFNPYAPGVNAADALAAEQVSAQTMVTLAAFAATAAGTGISQQDAFAAALSALSSVMQSKSSGGGTLDLTDPTDLAAVQSAFTTAVGSIPGVTADQTIAINGIIGDATTAIQNVNNKITSITNTDLSSAANGNIFGLLQVLQDQVEKAAEDEKTTPGSGTIGFTDPTAVDNAATNSAPTDIDLSASSISEDASSLVVGVLTTTDDGTSDFNFTYEIAEIEGSNDHLAFSINQTNGELSFVAQPDFETKSSYTVTIIATDEGGKSFSETFTISVRNSDNESLPVFSSGATANFAENGTGTVYTAVATDADGDTPTYHLVGGADQALFDIDSSSGALTFKSAPDYETPTDASSPPDNVYEVQIEARDGNGGTVSQTVSITVTNANDNNPAFSSGATANFAENGTGTVYTAVATDADGDTVTFSIVGGVDADQFELDSSSGALTFKSAPDFENPTDDGTNNVYEVELQADDGNGGKASLIVDVQIQDIDLAVYDQLISLSLFDDQTKTSIPYTYNFTANTDCDNRCYHDGAKSKLIDDYINTGGNQYNAGLGYVGWDTRGSVPVDFYFSDDYIITDIEVYGIGNIQGTSSIYFDENEYINLDINNIGTGRASASNTGIILSDHLTIDLNSGGNRWVMASEIDFIGYEASTTEQWTINLLDGAEFDQSAIADMNFSLSQSDFSGDIVILEQNAYFFPDAEQIIDNQANTFSASFEITTSNSQEYFDVEIIII